MKYKCVKTFSIPRVDEDWNHTEEEFVVEKDSVWYIEERKTPRITDKSGISLVNVLGEWMEIYPEDLKEYFEELEDEE